MHRPLNIFISHPSDFITDHRVHGDGQVAYEIIQRLAERGHRLHVAYTSADLSRPLHENVTLHRIVCRFPSSRVQELEYILRVHRLFRRLHRAHPFDLIHQLHTVFAGRSALLTHEGVPLVLGVFVASWPPDAEAAPAPLPWHSRAAAALLVPLIQMAHRWQQRHAAVLLLSTPEAERCLCDPARLRPRCVLLWCPGVNAEYFTPASGPRPPGQPTLLFVGNLQRRKGVLVLAEAFRTVWRQRPDARLVFVGDGSLRAALQQTVAEDESRSGVEFRGRVPEAEKRLALQTADLVVIPSFGEPYGNVATEAMACARPIVATRAGGLQHLVPPEGGRLVPPGNAPALAVAILDLLAQPERLPAMGEFNRRLVEECFAWPRIIDRLEGVYRSVLPS